GGVVERRKDVARPLGGEPAEEHDLLLERQMLEDRGDVRRMRRLERVLVAAVLAALEHAPRRLEQPLLILFLIAHGPRVRQVLFRRQDSEEEVVQGEADGVLSAGGRRQAVVLQAEHLTVGFVVPVFESPHEPSPDLVLDGQGDLPEVDLETGSDRLAAAHTLWIREVLEPERGPERLEPVVGYVPRDATPPGVGVLARGHQRRVVFFAREVEVDRERQLVDSRVEDRRVDDPPVVDAVVHLVAVLLWSDEKVDGGGELVDRREREGADRADVAVVVVRVVPALRETHGGPEPRGELVADEASRVRVRSAEGVEERP